MTLPAMTNSCAKRLLAIAWIVLATLAAGCNREAPKPPPAPTPEVTAMKVTPQDVAVSAVYVAKWNLARTRPLAEQNALSQKDLNDAQGQCATDCGACPGADTSSSRSKWSTASSFRTLAGSRSPILLGAATSPARWRATGATF